MDNQGREPNIKVFGKYVLEKRLGSGSFGQIYIGTDIKNEQYVAIKFVQHSHHIRNQ